MKSLTQGHAHPGSDNVQISLQSHKAMLTFRCFLPGFSSQKCLKTQCSKPPLSDLEVFQYVSAVDVFHFPHFTKGKLRPGERKCLAQGPSIACGLGSHLSRCPIQDSTPGGWELRTNMPSDQTGLKFTWDTEWPEVCKKLPTPSRQHFPPALVDWECSGFSRNLKNPGGTKSQVKGSRPKM